MGPYVGVTLVGSENQSVSVGLKVLSSRQGVCVSVGLDTAASAEEEVAAPLRRREARLVGVQPEYRVRHVDARGGDEAQFDHPRLLQVGEVVRVLRVVACVAARGRGELGAAVVEGRDLNLRRHRAAARVVGSEVVVESVDAQPLAEGPAVVEVVQHEREGRERDKRVGGRVAEAKLHGGLAVIAHVDLSEDAVDPVLVGVGADGATRTPHVVGVGRDHQVDGAAVELADALESHAPRRGAEVVLGEHRVLKVEGSGGSRRWRRRWRRTSS